ncbi:hypothetical protein BpHYR1_040247, partial [Brachionus plicatilis]
MESTINYNIKNPNKQILTVPNDILKLIKLKRKLKRLCSRSNNPTLKKLHNFIERSLNKKLAKIRQKKLEDDLSSLKNFNTSSSKHWKLITKIENGDCTKSSRSITIKVNNQLKTDDSDLISNIFADNLESIFSTDESVRDLDNQVLTPTLIEDNDTDSSITGSELLE